MTIWTDHTHEEQTYTFTHLVPFNFAIQLAAKGNLPARTVHIHVSFRCHTFTRNWSAADLPQWRYLGTNEMRTFDLERYTHSFQLPTILGASLAGRYIEFASDKNGISSYVTIETEEGKKYAAFFDVRKLRDANREVPNAVSLDCKSAYVLDPDKPHPGVGRVRLNTIVGHAMRGTRPHP